MMDSAAYHQFPISAETENGMDRDLKHGSI